MFPESFPTPRPLSAVSTGIQWIQGILTAAVHPRRAEERSTFPIFHETRGTCATRWGTTRRARRKVHPGKK